MLAKRCTRPYNYLVTFVSGTSLVTPAVPVAISATAAPTALFGPIATLAVNRTISAGFKRHSCGLAATGAYHGSARAHAGAPTAAVAAALVLGMGRSVTPTTAAATLLSLAAWLAASGRGVAAFLEKLLFSSSEDKFLTAVATSQ
jgi:hypothetical protein